MNHNVEHFRKLLEKPDNKYNHIYEFYIDGYRFILSDWNKYRSHYPECGFTIYIADEYTPCYWYNYEQGIFTNYYRRGSKNDQTKYRDYTHVNPEFTKFKKFEKFQQKYNKAINEKLILFFKLNLEMPKKEVEKRKITKI